VRLAFINPVLVETDTEDRVIGIAPSSAADFDAAFLIDDQTANLKFKLGLIKLPAKPLCG
jgi:hypothetical protein